VKKQIRAKALIDGTGRPPLADPGLTLEDGRIVAVEAGLAAATQADEILEFPDLTLLPGLIDSHLHLCFTARVDHATTRGEFETATSEQLLLRCLRHAQAALRAGITTVRDCGGPASATFTLRDAIQAGEVVGPRILASGPPITITGGHLHFCGLEADTAEEVRRAARQVLKAGADFVKIMATGGMMTAGTNPTRAQFTVAELRAAVEEAHRWRTHVAAHVLGVEGIQASLEAGVHTLEHGYWFTPDGPEVFDPQLAVRMAESPAYLGLTLPCVQRNLLPPDEAPESAPPASPRTGFGGEAGSRYAELRENMARWRRMLDAGVKFMVSSDAGVQQTHFHEFHRSLEALGFGLEMEPLEALVAATRAPAEALGLAQEIGTLEVGKRADFILVEGNPAEDIHALRRVRQVFRDGEWVVREGWISTKGTEGT